MDRTKVLYERPLPGGGYVHVEAEGRDDATMHRVHVAVERRSDPSRREGHEPPVIESAEGGSLGQLVRRLVAIASDNVEVARGLLRRNGGRARF
ncbi:MAG: hypothetical protein IT361_11125 [Gemmatimonadaceae bacterium]|nr:hypothetical protein [Gemmatimonadaceae bacterium]